MKNEKITSGKWKEFREQKWISAFEPQLLFVAFVFACLSAAIGMQITATVGTAPNTSILGVIFAILLGKIPLKFFTRFCNLERQNLVQTMCSAAAFSAGNTCFVAVATFFLMGEHSYMLYAALSCAIGMIISIVIMGKFYDSEIFPAVGAWPPGVATADAIVAGDEGGKKARQLIQGVVVGMIGSYFKIPMAGVGIVFISSIPAMAALGFGLITRGYSTTLFNGFSIGASNIPQGFMIGAGVMALIQCLIMIFKTRKANVGYVAAPEWKPTVTNRKARKSMLEGLCMYVIGAIVIGLVSGIFSGMSAGKIAVWVIWSGAASIISALIVGMAAMNSGWFPGYAITTVIMTITLFMGFEPIPIAVMVGYVGAVGPCFSDMGYDLKTGWLIRGKSEDLERELKGRKEQVKIEIVGALVGVIAVILFATMLIGQNAIPPISSVFAKTVKSTADSKILYEMLMWAIPGFLTQAILGKWMCGVLFGTGLLLNSPKLGVVVLFAICLRLIFGTKWIDGRKAGLVAGDGLFGFFLNVYNAFF